MGLGATLFHLSAFTYFIYVLYCLAISSAKNPTDEDPRVKGYKKYSLRFLTKWTYLLQLAYLGLALCGDFLDLIGKLKTRDKVNVLGNKLYTTIAGPMPLIVTSVFWSIYMIDRELIFPKFLDSFLAPWINHSIHTVNGVVSLADVSFVHHKFPSFGHAAKVLGGYLGAYAVCLFGTYFKDGVWLYPIFGLLSWPLRVAMCIGILFAALLFFTILSKLTTTIWGSEAVRTKSSKSQKGPQPKSKKVA